MQRFSALEKRLLQPDSVMPSRSEMSRKLSCSSSLQISIYLSSPDNPEGSRFSSGSGASFAHSA